jgi:hypothetical protein
MPLWVSLGLFAVLIGFIVWLFVRRKKIDNALGDFIQDSGFEALSAAPEPVVEAFGLKPLAWRGRIVVGDRTVPFLWLHASHISGGGQHSTLHIYHGVVLEAEDANMRVETRCREAMAKKNPWRDFFVYNTERPLLVERLPDRSLLVKWQGLNRADIYRKKIDFLSAVLA